MKLLLQLLNWWRLSYFLDDISPNLCRTNILFDKQLILEHYCPHHCTEIQKNHENSFGVLGPNLSFHTVPFLQKIRKILTLFCNSQWWMRVHMDRWKRLNSQDLCPFGDQKWKKSLEHYFVSWKNRTEFIWPFSLGVQKVHNGSKPLKIIWHQTSA